MIAAPSAPEILTPDPAPPRTEAPSPLRAVHTADFPALLRQLGASLLATTYQAGKLVVVRDEGDHLNTHFRAFDAPMAEHERTCGVCAIDLRSGQVVTLLRFESAVQELFCREGAAGPALPRSRERRHINSGRFTYRLNNSIPCAIIN
jgi:hypothetical protein